MHDYIPPKTQILIPAAPKMDASIEPSAGARVEPGAGNLVDRYVSNRRLMSTEPHPAPAAFEPGLGHVRAC